jgi:transposase
MLKEYRNWKRIYMAYGYTDLRCGIDGLAGLVQTAYHLDAFDEGTLFLFCGRKSDRIKGLVWEGDGFLLLYKRLADGRFQWPRTQEELKAITPEQLDRLLNGLNVDPTIHRSQAKHVI